MNLEHDDYPDCKHYDYIDPDEGIHDEFLKKKREARNPDVARANQKRWYYRNKLREMVVGKDK